VNNFYRYEFSDEVDINEVAATVTLALLATESLHGESRVRLEAEHNFDAEHRCCTINASEEVGRDLNRLFLGFITREFGPESFSVERLSESPDTAAA
jgi:hypothetical protein